MTKSQRMRLSAVMISSTMPSAKYSCSGSPDMLWNGNTASDGLSGRASAGGSPAPPRYAAVVPRHAALPVGGAAQRVHGAGEFHQHPVAGRLDQPAAMRGNGRVDHYRADRSQPFEGAFLVGPDQPRISRDISSHD